MKFSGSPVPVLYNCKPHFRVFFFQEFVCDQQDSTQIVYILTRIKNTIYISIRTWWHFCQFTYILKPNGKVPTMKLLLIYFSFSILLNLLIFQLLFHCCLVTKSCLTILQPHGLYPSRPLCPLDSPGKNTGVSCHVLLQGIFLIHKLSHWESPSYFIHFGLSHVWLFVTLWTAAHQASLSITNSRRLPKFMSIELVMLSNHLILCRPLLLLSSIFPSIRVFSNESVLCIRWPKYCSFIIMF